MEIGKKIRQLRMAKALTQEELANRCDLSKGFISQVERDLTSPSISTLVDILDSLGTNLKNFFNDEEDEKIVFTSDDAFGIKDEDLMYSIDWIVPNAQKNAMEPIMLTIEPGGRYKEEEPHEGEEFGYVLTGTVDVHLGARRHRAKKGECFYYKAKSNHYISNHGKGTAKVLWISTPPYF